VVTHLEPKARLVIYHQRFFSVDFSDVNPFGVLLGDVHKTGLEQFYQTCPQITQNKQRMHFQIADCQRKTLENVKWRCQNK